MATSTKQYNEKLSHYKQAEIPWPHEKEGTKTLFHGVCDNAQLQGWEDNGDRTHMETRK